MNNTQENCIIDFSNNRFILFDNNHKTEHIISIHQASQYDQQGFKFTAVAKNELEETQYDEAIAHYLGEN